jgi:6,7-dimethyl-8-ribityllumazine synthase
MLQSISRPQAPQQSGRIAFIQAQWHRDIVDQARIGFLAELGSLGHAESEVDVFEVPGAFEIPLHAKLLGRSGQYAAIVGAALVVDGGIYRHEFVAQAVVTGLLEVGLALEVPVLSVVLTPHHFHAGSEHQRFFEEHFRVKGAEAARAAAAIVQKTAGLRLRAAAYYGTRARGYMRRARQPITSQSGAVRWGRRRNTS